PALSLSSRPTCSTHRRVECRQQSLNLTPLLYESRSCDRLNVTVELLTFDPGEDRQETATGAATPLHTW
ncbi:hypothetical protein KUCAC02_011196, partial [Chaenocephalus aceratus]